MTIGTVSFQLVERLVAHLKKTANQGVSSSHLSFIQEFKRGRFQDDYVTKFVYVTVNTGDPNNPEEADSLVTDTDSTNAAYKHVPRETDGVEYWWRKGRVNFGCFYVSQNLSETLAAQYASLVMGRVMRSVESCVVNDLRDEFGEHAIRLFSYGQAMSESGGPPNMYIWKGTILYQCLTERSPFNE